MYSENSHALTHEFVVIRGNNDVAESSSDSESVKSETYNGSNTWDEDSEKKRECNLSDLGMDDSSSLPTYNTDGEESSVNFSEQGTVISEVFIKSDLEERSNDYLYSVIGNNFEDTEMS